MADNALSVDTDGVLLANLEKIDGTKLQRSEVTSLTLTIRTRRSGYAVVAGPRVLTLTDLHATSGDLVTPLLKTEQVILEAGKKEETHRVLVRGELTDGREFLFWQDFKVLNEES